MNKRAYLTLKYQKRKIIEKKFNSNNINNKNKESVKTFKKEGIIKLSSEFHKSILKLLVIELR